jgi:hypothetical protein
MSRTDSQLTDRPWRAWIALGLFLQFVGGVVMGATYPHDTYVNGSSLFGTDGYTETHGSTGGFVAGVVTAGVGGMVLLIGLISLGVYLGTRHLRLAPAQALVQISAQPTEIAALKPAPRQRAVSSTPKPAASGSAAVTRRSPRPTAKKASVGANAG